MSFGSAVVRGVLWLTWQAIRLPLFSLLLILEPVVRWVFSWLALWTFLIALVWEFTGTDPRLPFWGMIAFSVSCAIVLTAFRALLRFLSR
jgi:hypothetical protein